MASRALERAPSSLTLTSQFAMDLSHQDTSYNCTKEQDFINELNYFKGINPEQHATFITCMLSIMGQAKSKNLRERRMEQELQESKATHEWLNNELSIATQHALSLERKNKNLHAKLAERYDRIQEYEKMHKILFAAIDKLKAANEKKDVTRQLDFTGIPIVTDNMEL